MLTELQFQRLCHTLNLPMDIQNALTNIRNGPRRRAALHCFDSNPPSPYRRGVFDSGKMRRRFYFVQGQYQLPLLQNLEKTPEVLEYYVYPAVSPGSFEGKIKHHPQFLVMEETKI